MMLTLGYFCCLNVETGTHKISDGKKRIAFLDEGRGIGGAERMLFDFLRHLDKNRFDPVVVLSHNGKFFELLKNSGIETIRISSPSFLSLSLEIGSTRAINPLAVIYNLFLLLVKSLKLYFYLSLNGISLIQTNGMFEHIYGGIAARLSGLPCIWYMQDIPHPAHFWRLKGWVMNILARHLATEIVAASAAVKKVFTTGQTAKKVNVIYEGIDLSRYRVISGEEINRIKSRWDLCGAENIIGMTSRLVWWKGHIDFINAAKIVSERFPKAKFIIAGSAMFGKRAYIKELENLIAGLGLKDKVVFTGFLDEVSEVLNIIDIFVQSSLHPDPCPLSVLEAGLLKKAIVATCVGGIPEIIENGKEGILVKPNRPQDLSRGIIDLMLSPQKGALFGESLHRKIIRRFDIKLSVLNFEKRYSLYM